MTSVDELKVPRVAAAFDVLIRELKTGERDLEQAITERDDAEQCLSQMYYLVTGRSPEWSNLFGHQQALDDVTEALILLRGAAKRGVNS